MSKKEKQVSIDDIIDQTFRHLEDVVDANTMVGDIINLGDKMFVLPVSKISVGLISGGGNIPKSKQKEINAGCGMGFNIVPVGFVAVSNNDINFLPVNTGMDMTKNLIDKMFKLYEIHANKQMEADNEKD